MSNIVPIVGERDRIRGILTSTLTAPGPNPYATEDWRAFVGKIRASHPHDDAPRLIAADWLDDNGDPDRAELIRLQVRHAEVERNGWNWDTKEAVHSAKRRPHLVHMNAHRWWPWSLDDGFDQTGRIIGPKYTRGFMESCTCSSENWNDVGDEVYAREPVRQVTFTSPLQIGRQDDVIDDKRNGRHILTRTCTWQRRAATFDVYIDEREFRLAVNVDAIISNANEKLDAATTDTALMAHWWPGVAFAFSPTNGLSYYAANHNDLQLFLHANDPLIIFHDTPT